MGKKHQGNSSKESNQHVQCPIELVKSGKALSVHAKVVYLVIRSYDPSYPGIRRIADEVGCSPMTVQKAINELLVCRMIHKISGSQHYTNNQYTFFAPKNWMLTKSVPASSTPPPRNRATTWHRGVPPRGTGGVPPGGKELDQYNQINELGDGATRYCPTNSESGEDDRAPKGEKRCPDGQIELPEIKGVALPGDDIQKRKQHESQRRELQKAFVAGAISEIEFQKRVKELNEADGIRTFFVEPKPRKKTKGLSVVEHVQS